MNGVNPFSEDLNTLVADGVTWESYGRASELKFPGLESQSDLPAAHEKLAEFVVVLSSVSPVDQKVIDTINDVVEVEEQTVHHLAKSLRCVHNAERQSLETEISELSLNGAEVAGILVQGELIEGGVGIYNREEPRAAEFRKELFGPWQRESHSLGVRAYVSRVDTQTDGAVWLHDCDDRQNVLRDSGDWLYNSGVDHPGKLLTNSSPKTHRNPSRREYLGCWRPRHVYLLYRVQSV